jgi:hypothetical protein
MGIWSGFTSGISSIVGGAGAQLKTFTGGGSYLSDEEKIRQEALQNTVKNALADVGKIVDATPAGVAIDLAKKPAKFAGDLLLQGAIKLNNNILSPYIFRPLSTVALLTDTQSPLYKKGQYEEGFQFSDIKAAYNRSAKVSTMQALTKSDLIPFVKPLSAIVLSTGDINLDEVDLWSDASIEKNYVDNAVGRWFTGIGDLVVGNAALGAVGKIGGIAAKAGGTRAGLYTARKTIDELAADIDTGILHANSAGAQGTQTVSGSHMLAMAKSKDYGIIGDIVDKYSTNGKLLPLIREASTPEAVRDLILADKGNIAAMQRLASTAPDDLFDLSDTAAQLTSKYLRTGKPYVPEGEAIARLKSAYDAAIKKNPQFTKIREAFLDDNYNPLVGGKAFIPAEPVIGRAAFIKGQEIVRNVKSKSRFREFDDTNFFLSTRIGNKVVTELVRQVGTKMPSGHVTFSGLRPLDGRIELNAFLDNLKIFKDGSKELVVDTAGTTMRVGDIRRTFENKYMASIDGNQIQVLEEIDSTVGKLIAYKAGIFDDAEIAGYTSAFRSNINTGLNGLKANGYAIGHDGARIEASAQTIRQLEESYRFTPWDSIERKFDIEVNSNRVTSKVKSAADLNRKVLQDLTRVWSFDVLVRPMYITKQSIFEPIVSATMAQGMDFIWKDVLPLSERGMVGRAGLNIKNWTMQKGVKALNVGERKAINNFVADKRKMLSAATTNKDLLQVEVERLLKPGGSPAVKQAALAKASKELQAAERLLDKVELDLRSAVVPHGKIAAMPTLTMLERRINFIKNNPSISKKNAQKLVEAETSVARYKNVIDKMATNTTVIRDADNALAAAYDKIDNIIEELKPALKKEADVWGKSAEYKKRYYSNENDTRVLNGEVYTIDTFTGDKAPWAAAIRAETSNARTSEINALGELSVGTRQAILRRKVPTDTIKVSDDIYFAELEHIANRIVRQDPLMDLILGGKSMKELKAWASSEEGVRYLEHFDIYEAKQVPAYLANKVALVERTFPSIEARAAILQREVTASELQGWLANNVDELYDVVPTNFAYGIADAGLGAGPYASFTKGLNNMAAKTFSKMGSFENPVRNAFYNNAALDAMASKAKVLMDQGVKMTPERWNAIRQSSGREALQELEKTIYTVRRENRLLHNARMVAAFPTATVNAFYRYGRIAARNPVRATGFAYNYGRAFQNFGVDENGNPTTDINEITHLIIPGTKEIGLGNAGEGVALNSRSIGFLLNTPSPSYITSLSVGNIMKYFPGTEDGIKEALNIGGANLYETFFPYGAPTSATKAFIPPWANALWNAAVGPEGKSDYLSSWTSVYNYHHMLYEMGIEKELPSDEEIRKEVKALWFEKFKSGFISPAGVPYKVETNPMRLTTNLYYKLLEKNRLTPGISEQAARDAAGDEMLATMGTGFMIDRITATSNNRNLTLPGTYESYQRVFEDNDELVGKLASIDPDSINIVSLLTADLSRDPEVQSNNVLNLLKDPNLVLPGTSKRISDFKLTPKEAEAQRIKNRTWQQYSLVKDALEAKITDGKTLRAHPELKNVLDQLAATTLKEQSPEWYNEFQLSASGDSSYKYAKALQTITTDKNFMGKSGTSQFWQDASYFMVARNLIATFYQSLPDYDPRKSRIKDGYNAWVAETSKQWDPNFETIVNNYFENDTLKAVI